MTRGLFIALEGIDGTGKTTQVRLLAAWLRAGYDEVVETREPTDGVWGRRYREWARGGSDATPEEVTQFFVEDRREHVAQVIAPALERGSAVVTDRYVASTLAYQAAQGVDRKWLAERLSAEKFPEPSLTIWLRLSPERALARLGPDAKERFEQLDFLRRVDREYARLGLTPVDANGDRSQVHTRVCALVTAHLAGDE